MKRFMRFFLFVAIILLVFVLSACAAPDGTPGPNPVPPVILNFFLGFAAPELAGVFVGILMVILGGLGVQFNLYNAVKLRFKATDTAAMIVVYATIWVAALVFGLLTGDVNLGLYALTLKGIILFGQDVFALANVMFVGSQLWYMYLVNKDAKAPQVVSYKPSKKK